MRRALPWAALSLALTLSLPVFAQNKVAAEALFDEGRRLMGEGKVAEACPKFADSQKLDPAPGTLLNLANCYEKLGRTATAWATYRDAIAAAQQANKPDYEKTARSRAENLMKKLALMTITVSAPVQGMTITRDGEAVANAEWGTAIPVDPGKRAIEVKAPKKKAWKTDVDVPVEGKVTVTIPALEDAPEETPPPPTATGAGTVTPPPPPPGGEQPSGSGQRTIGLIVGGVGVVGLGIGTVFLVSALGKLDDSKKNCSAADPNLCNQTGVDDRDSARASGDIATVAFGVGAAALVGGAILFFTAPSPRKTGLHVTPTMGGAMIKGVF